LSARDASYGAFNEAQGVLRDVSNKLEHRRNKATNLINLARIANDSIHEFEAQVEEAKDEVEVQRRLTIQGIGNAATAADHASKFGEECSNAFKDVQTSLTQFASPEFNNADITQRQTFIDNMFSQIVSCMQGVLIEQKKTQTPHFAMNSEPDSNVNGEEDIAEDDNQDYQQYPGDDDTIFPDNEEEQYQYEEEDPLNNGTEFDGESTQPRNINQAGPMSTQALDIALEELERSSKAPRSTNGKGIGTTQVVGKGSGSSTGATPKARAKGGKSSDNYAPY
jgi:hypothetical protein